MEGTGSQDCEARAAERLLACGIIARSAGLFQNPKQICACDGVTLWEERDRPIAGKGRSKANAETPAAHL
ncbi:copper chaperone for superoxide dismutase-like protein [Lates japonicus]|uniref:Copper chaperone for superoxide dismutase-like protein n=1 Tax=Lates japonicus TaxID=270547 RepID=A0AAD3NLZ1_LATJO|nr:copper chaperone for superoxide dismutase-like protein [Lates japonicus]